MPSQLPAILVEGQDELDLFPAILGDGLYAPPDVRAQSPRLLLHASFLSFAHPTSGERIALHSEPPF